MLLPLIAAFGLWGVAELKQYNAGYQAIAERDQLKEEKKELQDQKDSLNIEVATLLALKRHYAEESQRLREETESQQDIIDRTYLRGRFTQREALYVLGEIGHRNANLDPKHLIKELEILYWPRSLEKGPRGVGNTGRMMMMVCCGN